jgi:threonine dehydrogenase-like Zn-dependent dehydrogenase
VAAIQAEYAPEGFDDVIILGEASPELIEAAAAAVGRFGVLALLTTPPARPVEIDLGRIHYDNVRYYGHAGKDVAAAYGETRHPNYKPGGTAWIAGGGGPMGQMHVQIAAQAKEGPALIAVSDLDDDRMALLHERLEHVAHERGREMVLLNPKKLGQEAFEARLRELAPGGFDDLQMLVPVPPMIAGMVPWAGAQGMLDIFAGIPRGSIAATDLGPVITRGVRFQGTSGSAIEDLVRALNMTETGEIDANAAVAAIGGLEALYDGLQAVIDMLVPGKIVLYPQIQGLPLTPLTELGEKLPEIAALLGPGGVWTRAAEKALLEKYL